MNLSDLTWPDGKNNMGGTRGTWYFALAADVLTWPTLPASPAAAADYVTLTGNFVMKSTKKFFKAYSTQENNMVSSENQGEIDGQSYVHKGEAMFPGSDPEALGNLAQLNNSNVVAIFVETEGQMRVIGSEAFPGKCKSSDTTGKATKDRKGTKIEITSYGNTPVPVYTGSVPLTPAP